MTISRIGEGSTPALHGNRLAIVWDHQGESFITVLDKRTGEVVCDEKFPTGGGLIMLPSDPAKQRVNIQTQTQLVQLTYTEKKAEEKKEENKKE